MTFYFFYGSFFKLFPRVLFFCSIFSILSSFSQNSTPLKPYDGYENISENRSVIYGSFIQRLGITSGGNRQDIYLINVETNHIYTMFIKKVPPSKKSNEFCFYIRPGTYEILKYHYAANNGMSVVSHTQTLTRPADSLAAGSNYYRFTITPNSMNYIGDWHFEEEKISFINNKEEADKKNVKLLLNLDPKSAVIEIPK